MVEAEGAESGLPRAPAWDREPAFWAGRSGPLSSTTTTWSNAVDEAFAEYLAHRIARFPGDLPSHTQRVLLHLRRRDASALYAALLDLFIALGEKDRPYRAHLLQRAAPLLAPEHRTALQDHLDDGLHPTDVVPLSVRAVLTKGLIGEGLPVVERWSSEPAAPDRDAAPEARRLISEGSLAGAQQLLEEALLRDPGNEEVAFMLLDLYVQQKDREGFLRMRRRLAAKAPEKASVWTAMSKMFRLD